MMFLNQLTLLLIPSIAFAEIIGGLRGRRNALDIRITEFEAAQTFRITVFDDLVRQDDGTFVNVEHIVSTPVINGVETSDFYLIELPQDIIESHAEDLQQGRLFISVAGTHNDGETVTIKDGAVIQVLDESPLTRRKLSGTVGQRSVAALRVSMRDGPTNMRHVEYNRQQIEEQLFKSDVSIVNQFGLCSGRDLSMTAAGVFEVTVPGMWSDWSSPAQLRNEALRLLAERYNVPSANHLADHVAVILPPNEWPGFVGNAGVNHWVSTLNNLWSLDVMVYMHELGHNLGLNHAKLSNNAGDYSSYMSATGWAPDLTGPKKCFNAASNRQLNWFQERTEVIDLNEDSVEKIAMKITLAAFSEFDKPNKQDPVLIEVGPYSLQYNFASSFNSGTELLRNRVTVAHSEPGATVVEKDGLVPNGPIFEASSFMKSGKTLRIEACTQRSGNSQIPNSMDIAITLGRGGSPCDIPVTTTPASTTTSTTTTTTPAATTATTTTTTSTQATTQSTTLATTPSRTQEPPQSIEGSKPICTDSSKRRFTFKNRRGKNKSKPCNWITRKFRKRKNYCSRPNLSSNIPGDTVGHVCQQQCAPISDICTLDDSEGSAPAPLPPSNGDRESEKPACPVSAYRVATFKNKRGKIKSKTCSWIGSKFNRQKKFCSSPNLNNNFPGDTVGQVCAAECASVTNSCRLDENTEGRNTSNNICPDTSLLRFRVKRRKNKIRTYRCEWIGKRKQRAQKFCHQRTIENGNVFVGEKIADICKQECAGVTNQCVPAL